MKELDVLFVHPNASGKVYQDLSRDFSAIEPPIWAALLANHVLHKGCSAKILDCEAERLSADESAKIIDDINARLTVVVVYGQQPSASTQNMQGAKEIIETLKSLAPNKKVLLTGLHPSAVSRLTMQNEKADFVCQGEGPKTIMALLHINNMNDEAELQKVPGLWFRNSDNKICFTKPAPLIRQDELQEELPGMAWDLLPMDKYRTSNWHAMSNNNDKEPFASLYTSLGCPFKCSFCCINAPFGNNNVENWDFGRNKFRYWDPDYIITEFDKIHQMGIRNVKIADEMFVMNKQHFLKLCNNIIDRGYDFNIWAYARIDTVKEEYLETLKKAGVNWLALGIESGNKIVRKDVVKGKFTEVNISDLVQKIKDAGINVIGNYIFGLPEDTIETMQETLDMAIELNCEFANFYSTMAYPGSKLYLDAIHEGWDLPDSYIGYSQHSYECKPLKTNHISAAEVLSFRDKAFNEYYTNEKYLSYIKEKFGIETYNSIKEMTKFTLRRKLLEK
jgi:anaerobic magnesium-protoporphyrin IX monomethyl ester cyclase